ncbi:L-lysine 2,3-aminomutase [Singulisphaera sp. GP187]|uniref:KamA family radical SAM protein n=1 Tax=Singulisphaera sp. GP187 TaxID=1882752 RepID=UPI0009271163|nr:KamA family radical SAM protein [Singulisphaera sp. GP187]SIO03961.1 L-lysine 2,3-aminomutase [Singulisphaera sp. GP187]
MGEPSSSTSTAVTIPDAVEVADGDEPPSSPLQPTPRHPVWANVPDSDWNDWHWQSQNAVRHPRQILDLIPFTDDERHAIESLQAQYKLAIPPYYFSLIDRFDPLDPIRLQSVPSPLEMTGAEGEDDPLDEDKDSPVPGLTHRYPDRALLVTTHVCTMYCRFCTRKRATMKRGGWDSVSRDDQRMVEYVRDHPEIHDVIVSGGDPLTLPLEKLAYFVESLSAIPHLDVIRIGTRVPVTLPQRIEDNNLLDILESSGKIWIQTHFNHPREVTSETRRACDRLRMRGLPINNHAVLLKGVNDSLATQRALCRALLRIKVRPYYLFHCDPVTGAGHFRTPVWKGIEIIEGLRGHISGLGVPTYVVDAPRGGGKIPLMPNYLLSATNDSVVLRNYEGVIVNYHPTGEPPLKQAAVVTQGVSALLEGQAEVLVPEGNPRLLRRRARGIANGLNGHGTQGASPKKSNGSAGNGHGQGHTPDH